MTLTYRFYATWDNNFDQCTWWSNCLNCFAVCGREHVYCVARCQRCVSGYSRCATACVRMTEGGGVGYLLLLTFTPLGQHLLPVTCHSFLMQTEPKQTVTKQAETKQTEIRQTGNQRWEKLLYSTSQEALKFS